MSTIDSKTLRAKANSAAFTAFEQVHDPRDANSLGVALDVAIEVFWLTMNGWHWNGNPKTRPEPQCSVGGSQ